MNGKFFLWLGIMVGLLVLFVFEKNTFIQLIAILIGVFILYFLLKRKKKELGEGEKGPVREELKKIVLKRQMGRCAIKHCNFGVALELHHRVPRSIGGDNRLSNLVYLCPNHHAEAHLGPDGKVDYTTIPNYLRGVRR